MVINKWYITVILLKVHTCKPAMGLSFAAGTTDGPGGLNVKQGTAFMTLIIYA